jgi:hypothetical protein
MHLHRQALSAAALEHVSRAISMQSMCIQTLTAATPHLSLSPHLPERTVSPTVLCYVTHTAHKAHAQSYGAACAFRMHILAAAGRRRDD